jgi:hypothetical protein
MVAEYAKYSAPRGCAVVNHHTVLSVYNTLGFLYATAPFTHPDGGFRRFWFDGVSLFCSIGVDIASFYQ